MMGDYWPGWIGGGGRRAGSAPGGAGGEPEVAAGRGRTGRAQENRVLGSAICYSDLHRILRRSQTGHKELVSTSMCLLRNSGS